MKAWSVIGLLFAAAILATVPISPQVTPRGVELRVAQAQAITYGRYRRVARRAYRRSYRYGYAAAAYGPAAAAYGYADVDDGPAAADYGYRRVWVSDRRWCTIAPSYRRILVTEGIRRQRLEFAI
jgi:hypothetical protein